MISIRTLSRSENPQLEEDKLLGRGIPEGLNVESPPQYRNAYQPIPRKDQQRVSLIFWVHAEVSFDQHSSCLT
ncbi:hypothetical protein ABKV19_019046 [Rosa sericea]